jgi:glycosyltransferase XagB
MQTWAVHMRRPLRLLQDLRLPGFIAFQLVVGGNVLAALIHPIFAAIMLHALATGRPLFGVNGIPEALTWVFAATLCAGYLVTVIVGIRGLARRRLLSSAWWLFWVIGHWLLLSLAAWRALIHLCRNPQRWEKTEHGLARNSRLAGMSRVVPAPQPPGERSNRRMEQRRDAA